jgi:hypothetical protein
VGNWGESLQENYIQNGVHRWEGAGIPASEVGLLALDLPVCLPQDLGSV